MLAANRSALGLAPVVHGYSPRRSLTGQPRQILDTSSLLPTDILDTRCRRRRRRRGTPWKATDVMKERTKFVLESERRWNEAEGGPVNMAELCRMFGVSRQTGYTWVER